MRPFWKSVLSTTCGLAILLIGGASYSSEQEKKSTFQEEAHKQLRKAAEQGNADAQYNLGRLYARGRPGVPPNSAEAVPWYRKAAEQGNADAQYDLGLMYEQGQGIPLDAAEAARWYRKAAEQGRAHAADDLAVMYDQGRGVPRDAAEAKRWRFKAAEARTEEERKAAAAKAEERRKVRAGCAGLYQSTADKRVGDLTVREQQAVRACQALGLYPPQ